MIKHPEGRIEGTPDELAAYQVALTGQREPRTGLPIVFDPFPPASPSHTQDFVLWSRQDCDACRNGGVCGCVLAGPTVTC